MFAIRNNRVVWMLAYPPAHTAHLLITPDKSLHLPNKVQTGVDYLSTVILTCLVHIGCHLNCHVFAQPSVDMKPSADEMGTYGMLSVDYLDDN
jgi:hypothetical protein